MQKIMPDITVTEGKWTCTQTYGFSDIYVVEVKYNGRTQLTRLGDYKTEDQLRAELKKACEVFQI